MDLNNVKPTDLVRPIDDDHAATLSTALGIEVSKSALFRVLVVVKDGLDYRGRKTSGLIVEKVTAGGALFPYVFSAEHFRPAKTLITPRPVARPAGE